MSSLDLGKYEEVGQRKSTLTVFLEVNQISRILVDVCDAFSLFCYLFTYHKSLATFPVLFVVSLFVILYFTLGVPFQRNGGS